jgi:4'-phosphopantetheinyl transferase EntD
METLSSGRIEAMLGPGILCEVVMPLPEDFALCGIEEAQLSRAIPRRRREFAAGRLCAKKALSRLGLNQMELPIGANRAPVWPTGIVGTISHTDSACIAAVSWRGAVRSIGADVEPNEPLERDLYGVILTDEELTWLEAQPAFSRGRLARLIFSAKESFYKLQYPLTYRFLDFHDVEVKPAVTSDQFSATLLSDAGKGFARGAVFHGRFVATAGLIVTGMVLRCYPVTESGSQCAFGNAGLPPSFVARIPN